MKRILSVLLAALLAFSALALIASAEAMIDPEVIISDLTPCEDMKDDFTLTGCTVDFDPEGFATFTLTASSATIHIDFMDVANNVLFYGSSIMPKEGAFFTLDYQILGNITLGDTIWHYTRKDKEAAGAVADLYLVSMLDTPDYKQYSSICKKDEAGGVVSVWDWGTYVSSSDAKLFTDKGHCFTSWDCSFIGTPGSSITFFTVAVTNTDVVEGLGSVRLVDEPDEPSEDPVESSEEPAVSESSTEDSAAESDPATESVEESDTESAVESEEESKAESAAESKAEESAAQSAAESAPAESEPEDNGGLPVGAIIGIVAAALAVIAAVVVVIVKKKK